MTKDNQLEIIYDCPLSNIIQVKEKSNLPDYVYKKTFSGKEFYLKEHVLEGTSILPGVAYLEIAGAAFALLNNQLLPNKITHIAWAHPFCLGVPEIYINLKKKDNFWQCSFNSGKGNSILHARLRISQDYVSSNKANNHNIKDLFLKVDEEYSKEEIFTRFKEGGAEHGSSLRSLESIGLINDYQALGFIRLPNELDRIKAKKDFNWHPSIMDGILQTAMGLFFHSTEAQNRIFYPYTITEVTFYHEIPLECWVYVKRHENISGKLLFDAIVFDSQSYEKIAEFSKITWLPKNS